MIIGRKPLKRKSRPALARRAISPVGQRKIPKQAKQHKKKQTQADFLRSWGIHPRAWMRYSGLKGVYWHYFSKMIRARDYQEYGGLCMTCLKPVEKGDDQCGHLFPARDCGFLLLFHQMNNHLQHSKCNNPRFTPGAGVFNTININRRYGAGTVERLATQKPILTKEWSKAQYEKEIKALPTFQHLSTVSE